MRGAPAWDPAGAAASYLEAIRAGDRRRAFAVLDGAREDGATLGDLYMGVLQPALREIGRLWQENRITVADEHLATAITQAGMARLYQQAFAPAEREAPTLVAACADLERHEVGLRMLCDLLDLRGWETVYLGSTVPVASLVEMVRAREPRVVALSATIPPHLPRLREMIRAVRDAGLDPPPLVMVGGRPFLDRPELAERFGADLTASSALEAVRLLEERLGAER